MSTNLFQSWIYFQIRKEQKLLGREPLNAQDLEGIFIDIGFTSISSFSSFLSKSDPNLQNGLNIFSEFINSDLAVIHLTNCKLWRLKFSEPFETFWGVAAQAMKKMDVWMFGPFLKLNYVTLEEVINFLPWIFY